MAQRGGLGQWMLNVVHLGFQPSEIKALSFSELRYFSECHDKIQEAYKRAWKSSQGR
jgi:hypothetical protein